MQIITLISIIHGFCGPGRAVNELRELAASLSACSTREAAAREAAYTESLDIQFQF